MADNAKNQDSSAIPSGMLLYKNVLNNNALFTSNGFIGSKECVAQARQGL